MEESSSINTSDALIRTIAQIETVLRGKRMQVELAVACLLAGGHLLIEDRPGTGKTILAQSLAASLGLGFCRVQFTNDLLPGDILGVSIFDRATSTFDFRPGPIFTSLLLADEINRAPPKTQSALLEAMEERQVSIDGNTHSLPDPFFVIATQNPDDAAGTFPLPDAQLDRFLMRLQLGLPDRTTELALLEMGDRRMAAKHLEPALTRDELAGLQAEAAAIHAGSAVLDYIWALLDATRKSTDYEHGLSTRAGLALLRAARAWALLRGSDAVLPGHVQAVLPAVAAHRLTASGAVMASEQSIRRLIKTVPVT